MLLVSIACSDPAPSAGPPAPNQADLPTIASPTEAGAPVGAPPAGAGLVGPFRSVDEWPVLAEARADIAESTRSAEGFDLEVLGTGAVGPGRMHLVQLPGPSSAGDCAVLVELAGHWYGGDTFFCFQLTSGAVRDLTRVRFVEGARETTVHFRLEYGDGPGDEPQPGRPEWRRKPFRVERLQITCAITAAGPTCSPPPVETQYTDGAPYRIK